jgi:FAD/FMN-containing dehydrogenase/Fe-S oxidoreductase
MSSRIQPVTPPTTPRGTLRVLPGRGRTNTADQLAAELRRTIRGEVRFDTGTRSLYATDLSLYRHVPIGVVIPRDVEDVIQTVDACRKYEIPILGRGCGTSLAGQCCNVAVILDFSKYMNHILELDPQKRMARVEPGVICDQLRDAAEEHHLTFAPDPATHKYCTLGGMIGNNSCGVHTVMGGRTADNVEELEILCYDGSRMRVGRTSDEELQQIMQDGGRRGEIYRKLRDLRDRYAEQVRQTYPKIPRRVSGYNLDELLPENGFNVARALVGTESTCMLLLNATVRLIPSPPKRVLLVISYPDIFLAGDNVATIRTYGPIGLEAVQQHVIENMHRKRKPLPGAKLLPEGDTWVLAEFGGDTQQQASEKAHQAMEKIERELKGHLKMKLVADPHEQKSVWHIREVAIDASRVPGVEDAFPAWEDAAVAPKDVGNYLREFYEILKRHRYRFTTFGHFGDGCIHCRIAVNVKTADGVKDFRRFMNEAADLVVCYGGSLSGEHGDGQLRAELLPKMYGPELIQAFREFKSIWDPNWRMNPGKVVDPYKLDENLRIGPDYRPQQPLTHFHFPEDHGSIAEATERCFGVGRCRGLDGGTMCPSFMVTREESYTTRGRAHLLFEMLRGDSILDGWRDDHVKEALDLCLSCKGCKGDCPVSVDIATYKAEFLSHYWEGRLRPRTAYALGLVNVWMRAASLAPGLANLVTQTPLLRDFAKAAAGIAPQRAIPALAPQSFRQWFRGRARESGRSKVILWPDTFNNYFHPDIAQSAVAVLDAAGFDVAIPQQNLCCGRPLYDFGMLDRAERYLRRILAALRDDISAGVPVIVLEPSCAAVFRDELPNLLANDEDAKRLSQQTFLIGEFLEKKAPQFQPPKLNRRALVHGHCHQKAVLDPENEISTLKKLGLDCEVLESGCCGMAGSFGFEKEKYDVSVACGERVLLPAVREADADTLIIANGFSCQEQIAQLTERRALHLAQVLDIALHQTSGEQPGRHLYPETELIKARDAKVRASLRHAALTLAGSSVLGGAIWLLRNRKAA